MKEMHILEYLINLNISTIYSHDAEEDHHLQVPVQVN